MHRPGIIGARPHSGGGGYVGPLDIVPGAVAAYGQWALSSAMRGQPLYTIADGAGGATQSFSSDATTGDAPIAAIEMYSATPFGQLLNDQSGNGFDVLQSAPSQQPSWVSSGPNGLSAFDFGARDSGRSLKQSAGVTYDFSAGAVTGFCVAKRTNDGLNANSYLQCFQNNLTAYFSIAGADDAAGLILFLQDDDGNNGTGGVSTAAPTVTGAYHLFEYYCDFTGGDILVDGTSTAMDTSGIFGSAPLGVFTFLSVIGFAFAGQIVASMLWNSALGPSTRTALRQNIATRCGIILP